MYTVSFLCIIDSIKWEKLFNICILIRVITKISFGLRGDCVKIGQFAKKYNLTINTIRYYMEIGLLIPVMAGKQYIFTEECERDIELVLKLKKFKMPINTILVVLALFRCSELADNRDLVL